jgi:bacterioferritin-associated ferredoxin
LDNESGTGRRLVCYCFGKTAEEIRSETRCSEILHSETRCSEILRLGIKTPEEATRLVLAGSGCTLCRVDIEKLLADARESTGGQP